MTVSSLSCLDLNTTLFLRHICFRSATTWGLGVSVSASKSYCGQQLLKTNLPAHCLRHSLAQSWLVASSYVSCIRSTRTQTPNKENRPNWRLIWNPHIHTQYLFSETQILLQSFGMLNLNSRLLLEKHKKPYGKPQHLSKTKEMWEYLIQI